MSRLANTDNTDWPIYGLSAQFIKKENKIRISNTGLLALCQMFRFQGLVFNVMALLALSKFVNAFTFSLTQLRMDRLLCPIIITF